MKETTPLERFSTSFKCRIRRGDHIFGRLATAAAIAVLLCTAATGQPPPTFRAEARLVVLHATVTSARGEIVTDLEQHAFTVYENGRPQPISVFRRDDVPVSIGLVIDNSGSMRAVRANVEAAAVAFVRASHPLDEAFVVNFAEKARVDVPMTRDTHALEAGIARVDSIGGTAMRDAVLLAERYLRQHASHDRRVLLVITDGNDNASTASVDQLRRTVDQSETAVFGIGLFRDDDARTAARGRDGLDHLTELTGGAAYYPAAVEQIHPVVLEIARQIRNQYTIAYAPRNQALDGSYRSIRVKVAGPGGSSVRTRRGYRATPSVSP
jgi:Ca-activated chloride channel homolog